MRYDLDSLESFIEEYTRLKEVPGISVFVTGPEGLIYKKSLGFCDVYKTKPVNEETIFGIASMSKSVTCTCLSILESEGKLSFMDPASKYLPELKIPGTPREALLIHHLANMTSGLPPLPILTISVATHTKLGGWIGEEGAKLVQQLKPNSYGTIDEIVEYITDSEAFVPLGAPGEYVSYSNDSYALLSSIVDAASGSTLERFAYERIFEPLGMPRTTFDISEAKAMGNITSLFTKTKDELFCTDDWPTAPAYRGCGWLKSTSEDMCKYYEMLACDGVYRGRRILPEGAVTRMIGRAFPETAENFYCYGLNKRVFRDVVICEHSGGLIGISSKGGFFKDKGFATAILMNVDEVDANPLMRAVCNTLLGLPLETSHMPYGPAGFAPSQPAVYKGTYSTNEFFPVKKVTVYLGDDGELRAKIADDEFELLFCDTTRFIASDGKKPLEQCTLLRFLVRDDKAWAVNDGGRMLLRE